MSQFRQAGNFYVSQWNGDDLNAGTDPLLPKASISGLPNSSNVSVLAVIGPGHYIESWGFTQKRLIADGKVIIDGAGTGSYGANSNYITGVHFKNFVNAGANSFNNYINDCVFENCITVSHTLAGFRNVFLTDTNLNWFSTQGSLKHAILIGKQLNTQYFPLVSYSFVGINSRICLVVNTSQINNCINGAIIIGGVTYESKKLIDGTARTDANPAIPDVIAAFPNFYTQGNFSCTDPKFIDVISRTVAADSPLLLKADINGFIGGVKVGKKIDLDESGFNITKTGIDDSNPNFWKIASGVTFAKIRITGKVSDSLISAQVLEIRIPFNFNGFAIGGSANNNNVPDAWNSRTTPDAKGTRPNRLTFEVRSSRLANPVRDNSLDWDNDSTNSPSTSGQYYLMEYGSPMLHHVVAGVAYGNADANAINAAVKLPFNYRSLDIIITLTNIRVI